MKVFISDIKQIDWLAAKIGQQSWGYTFLKLGSEPYFVFDYNLFEKDSSIEVVNSKITFKITDYIYKGMKAEHLGYMRQPFDTSNYLFFSLLKSACTTEEENEKLTNLFVGYKMHDIEENKKNLKHSLKGSQDITSSISFNTALNNIFKSNPQPIHGLCMIYDLIDRYSKYFHDKSIYGELLNKIVRAIKNPNGGLIPEYAGSKMRYLIVGEVAASRDISMKDSLELAKELYRSGNSSYETFLATGWYFNKFDFKWRKRISDDKFFFDQSKLNIEQGAFYFIPEGYNPDPLSFKSMISGFVDGNPSITNLIVQGYDGRIKDYISFDEAFKLYPSLKNLYSVFALNLLNDARYSFYFSDSTPNQLVLIAGKQIGYDFDKVKYTALHEIQHFVQREEGFGNGGNTKLASLIDAVGGSMIRDFLISLKSFQNRFTDVVGTIPIQEFDTLISKLKQQKYQDYEIRNGKNIINVSRYYVSMLDSLQKLIQDKESIAVNSNNISYILLTLYSMIEESDILIYDFVKKYIGNDYLEFFQESLLANKRAVEKEAKMTKEGWTPYDLYILNFQAYESLNGEVEARFTQQTSKMPEVLRDYFDFYTSETINPSKVQVYSDAAFMDEGKFAEAGVETTEDNKYIIHLPEEYSNSINLLHETGHILFDLLRENITIKPEHQTNATEKGFENVEEYFCASLVDYVQRKNIDPMLTTDIEYDRQVLNYDEFDTIIDEAFYFNEEINEAGLQKRLTYVMALVNNIEK